MCERARCASERGERTVCRLLQAQQEHYHHSVSREARRLEQRVTGPETDISELLETTTHDVSASNDGRIYVSCVVLDEIPLAAT